MHATRAINLRDHRRIALAEELQGAVQFLFDPPLYGTLGNRNCILKWATFSQESRSGRRNKLKQLSALELERIIQSA